MCFVFDHPTAHPPAVRVYKQNSIYISASPNSLVHNSITSPNSLVHNSINSVTTKYIWTLFAPNGQ